MDGSHVLKAGDVVFVRGDGFISWAIEEITHSAYSHVALAIDDDALIEAQGGRSVGDQVAAYYAGKADVYRTDLTPEQLQGVVKKAESKKGEPYDYALDLWELVRYETGVQLPYHEGKDLICSMLVVDSFRPEYDPCPGVEYPAPGDLAKSKLWHYVFSY